MYRIYADSDLIYDSTIDDFVLTEANLDLEGRRAGSFVFGLYPNNPFYSKLQKLKTTISIYQRDYLLYKGRILNEDIGFYNEKTFTCEGELAYFNDTIMRPYEFSGTPEELLSYYITEHNKQVSTDRQFVLGNVTVKDANDYIVRADSTYPNTWKCIQNKLLDLLGGHLILRHVDGKTIIDYLADIDVKNLQDVEYGENLLDISQSIDGDEIATAIIPLGAKQEDDARLTIASVNNGKDYVYHPESVEKYGWIFKTVTFDDVTLPSNLLTKANEVLENSKNFLHTVELTAVDLNAVDKDIQNFRLGRYVHVVSPPHNIDDYMLVNKLKLNLLKIEDSKLTLGDTRTSFSESQAQNDIQNGNKFDDLFNKAEETEKEFDGIRQETNTMYSEAIKEANRIVLEVVKEYVSESEFGLYKEAISTAFEQNYEMFEMSFNKIVEQITKVDGDTQSQFTEIRKYIRFIDGKIVLGEDGNLLTLTLANDRIYFEQNGIEVAYFSNNKLYVTDIHVTNSLRVGNFAAVPRANGSLDIRLVNS